ncbi:MAG: EAL domain-containing protein [Acidimicrobiales bacterium]|nr:EAL domain-containing protein [Acidimicrobiales bacterium]
MIGSDAVTGDGGWLGGPAGSGSAGGGGLSAGRDNESQQLWEAADERYRAVLDSLAEIVFELDANLRFRFLSAAWERVMGVPAHVALGHRADELGIPAAHAAIAEELGRLVDGEADQASFELPAVIGGESGWLDMRVTAQRDPDGRFTGASGVMTDVSDRRRTEERLARLALHDPLTGLPNRSLLCDRVAQAMARSRRSQEIVAVLFIDLDHFKVLNDSLGHDAGDEVLAAVAARLAGSVRSTETVARVGGDEFVVVAEGLAEAEEALSIAARVHELLLEPVHVAGIEHLVAASIGVVTVAPGELRSANDLLAEADLAMYRAKERGRGRVEVFQEELRARAADRMSTEAALRRAIDGGELEVFYQPVIALGTGAVQGAEALVRWRHPERGLIPPALFVPTAEETGLIAPMTAFVLSRALRDFAGLEGLSVAVNISARQLIDLRFPDDVAAMIAASGIDASRVTLEITETAVLADPEASLVVLHRLRDQGLTLALDDFGTGYSALAHLQQLPVGCVKIDRSFVDGITASATDRALVQAVAGLASALNLRLVAEGVESEAQAAVLRTMDCPSAQGFLYAKPLPFDEFLAFVEAHEARRAA